MANATQHTARFRKNLKQFMDLKQAGKLNGKAAVVEEKLKAAAGIAGLDFEKELKNLIPIKPKKTEPRENPPAKKKSISERYPGHSWTGDQKRAVEKIDDRFEEELEKKGIKKRTKQASDLWWSGGYASKMKQIFKKTPRKNFTFRLYPVEKTKQTKRFLSQAMEAEKAVVRGMVTGQDYDAYLASLSEPQKNKFYQNLAYRLGLFRDDGQSLWISYVHRPLQDFARAIEEEAKKMFTDQPRQNPNRTDIRLVKPKYQFTTEKEALQSVTAATGLKAADLTPNHSGKSWRWKRAGKPSGRSAATRQNPATITLIMLGVAEEVQIDQGNGEPVLLLGPLAMLTNKKKNTLFVVPFDKMKKMPARFNDAKANEVYEMWHNFEPGGPDFEMPWPQEEPKPVGWAHSILYASDKILREWDRKGKLNLYEHDFDPGKRPSFKKGGMLMITNLKIDERGILN